MPRGDKTGPRGEGAMTGRGMGFCAGYDIPGNMNPGYNPRARGDYGFGRGMGRGNRWGFHATDQPGWIRGRGRDNMSFPHEPQMDYPQKKNDREEIHCLKSETQRLKQTLEKINSRIDELSKTNDK